MTLIGLDNFGRFSEPALLILVSLASGEKHGYAIAQDIERFASARLGPGTLYGALARLEHHGLILALPAVARRRPYRLTDSGRHILHGQLSGMQKVVELGKLRLTQS